MFRTGLPSFIRSLVLHTQQQVFVIQVMLTASEIRMELVLVEFYTKINLRNSASHWFLLYHDARPSECQTTLWGCATSFGLSSHLTENRNPLPTPHLQLRKSYELHKGTL